MFFLDSNVLFHYQNSTHLSSATLSCLFHANFLYHSNWMEFLLYDSIFCPEWNYLYLFPPSRNTELNNMQKNLESCKLLNSISYYCTVLSKHNCRVPIFQWYCHCKRYFRKFIKVSHIQEGKISPMTFYSRFLRKRAIIYLDHLSLFSIVNSKWLFRE